MRNLIVPTPDNSAKNFDVQKLVVQVLLLQAYESLYRKRLAHHRGHYRKELDQDDRILFLIKGK